MRLTAYPISLATLVFYGEVNMQYKAEDVEKYILAGYDPKKIRPVEKNILAVGHWCCCIAVIFWAVHNGIIISNIKYNNYEGSLLSENIPLILLTPIVIALAIRFGKFGLKRMARLSMEQVVEMSRRGVVASSAGAGIGVAIWAVFLRNSDFSLSYAAFMALFKGMILLFVFCATGYYHKVYLIHKYCPYLKYEHRQG